MSLIQAAIFSDIPEIELLANVFIGKLKVSFNFFFQINCITEDFSKYVFHLYFEKNCNSFSHIRLYLLRMKKTLRKPLLASGHLNLSSSCDFPT